MKLMKLGSLLLMLLIAVGVKAQEASTEKVKIGDPMTAITDLTSL